MDMNGERRIPAPRQRVWDALNDPEMLKAAIPGCESVTKTAEDAFEAKVSILSYIELLLDAGLEEP